MRMKKLLSAAAALFICGTLLAACGNGNAETAAHETASETTGITELSQTETETEETVLQSNRETEAQETASEEEFTDEYDFETDFSSAETEELPDETEPVPEEEIVFDDSTEEEAVSSEFADIDEFLAEDFFSIEGKETSSEACPSFEMYSILRSSDEFIMELKAFDGSSSIKYAVSADKSFMERNISDETDITMKYIVRDSKMYIIDDSNKLAMYVPVDENWAETGSAEAVLESFGINISRIGYISNVKIGGKSYILETGTSTAMLFNTDGSLYAFISGGNSLEYSLYEWTVSDKVPSGIFDIPKDYTEVDMEAMMAEAE